MLRTKKTPTHPGLLTALRVLLRATGAHETLANLVSLSAAGDYGAAAAGAVGAAWRPVAIVQLVLLTDRRVLRDLRLLDRAGLVQWDGGELVTPTPFGAFVAQHAPPLRAPDVGE